MRDLRYLALGDSYTIGEDVQAKERWPHQFVELLNSAGINVDLPEIIAVTGWTTDELQTAIVEKQPTNDYNLVSLLIGVNNQYRDYPIETYRKEFTELLNSAISFGDNVFVVSIPDYGVTPFGKQKEPERIASEVDNYNMIAKGISGNLNIPFVDITTVSKLAKSNVKMTASDGLHPTGEMYKLWTEEIYPVVLRMIKK
jgi:lysophospholipase L1-like esterase